MMVSGSRPLPGLMSPRCSIALMVLRLADRGRISSSSFQPPQNRVPTERISFKLVSLLHVRQQVLFNLCEFRQQTSTFLLRHSSRPFAGGLVHLAQSKHWGLSSAAKPVSLPKLKPRTMREHFVVPSIRRREVACAEWPNIRRFEHFLYLLDVVNSAFNVHSVSISNIGVAIVKRNARLHVVPSPPSGSQRFLTPSSTLQIKQHRIRRCSPCLKQLFILFLFSAKLTDGTGCKTRILKR